MGVEGATPVSPYPIILGPLVYRGSKGGGLGKHKTWAGRTRSATTYFVVFRRVRDVVANFWARYPG